MTLPLSIDNVPYYRVVRQYCFQGDLIIVTGRIFFFPHTDLEQQRAKVHEVLDWFHGLGFLFDVGWRILFSVLLPLIPRTSNKSGFRGAGFWRVGESNEVLKSKLDQRIAELKMNYQASVSLPIPARFNLDEVSNLRLSATGVLSFDAQSDHHDFAVGLSKKRLLREALWESGFTSGLQRI